MKESDKIENNITPPDKIPGPHTTDPAPRRKRARYKHHNHRRTGKVARLPAVIRHEVCLRFMRYEEYKDIIAWLVSQGHPGIRECNLSRWRKGGFQDWLRNEHRKKLDLINFMIEVSEELLAAEKAKLSASATDHGPRTTDPIATDNGPLTTDSPNPSRLPPLLGGGPESTLNN